MKQLIKVAAFLILVFIMMGGFALAQQDAKGCKDHPLFTRMPEFYIDSCEKKEFDAHAFIDPVTKKKVTVEGRLYRAYYYLKKEHKGQKSIYRSRGTIRNAIEKIGGVSLWMIQLEEIIPG